MNADVVALATNLIRQGGKVVPVALGTKNGLAAGYKMTVLPEPGTEAFYQAVGGKNIALLMGTTFVDVDLDTVGLERLAKVFLPATPFCWGRKSNPRSHWLYRAPNEEKKRVFTPLVQGPALVGRKPGEAVHPLLELRSGDCLSTLPGSVHPSGEVYEFGDGGTNPEVVTPQEAEWEDLHRRVTLMALCWGSVESYVASGQRDTFSYCLAGLLCRHGFDQELARLTITMLAKVAEDEEWDKRGRKVEMAWAQAQQEQGTQNLPGYRKLAEVAGEEYRAWFRKVVRGAAPIGSTEAPDLNDAAAWFADEYGDDVLYHEGTWFRWRGTHWQEVAAHWGDQGPLERQANQALQAVGMKLSRASLLDEVVRVASRLVERAEFAEEPGLLNCPAGTWDLGSGALEPHARERGLREVLPYTPEPGPCPGIDRFLEETIPDEQGRVVVETHVGLALLRDRRFHKALILLGPSRSGKSTLGQLASMACGEAPDQQPTAHLFGNDSAGTLSRVNWAHLRLAHVSEFPAEAFQHGAETFKAMVGHNSVTMRHHYKEESRKNQWRGKLLLTTNDPPRLLDPGGAVEQRLLVVECPFGRGKREGDIDEWLRDRLTPEVPQWGWRCIQRARALLAGQREQYRESPAMVRARRQLLLAGDPIQGWIEEYLVEDDVAFVTRTDLYNHFKAYLDSVGKARIMQTRMLQGLRQHFPHATEGRQSRAAGDGLRERGLHGLRLRRPGDQEPGPRNPGPLDPGPQGPDTGVERRQAAGAAKAPAGILGPAVVHVVHAGPAPVDQFFGPIYSGEDLSGPLVHDFEPKVHVRARMCAPTRIHGVCDENRGPVDQGPRPQSKWPVFSGPLPVDQVGPMEENMDHLDEPLALTTPGPRPLESPKGDSKNLDAEPRFLLPGPPPTVHGPWSTAPESPLGDLSSPADGPWTAVFESPKGDFSAQNFGPLHPIFVPGSPPYATLVPAQAPKIDTMELSMPQLEENAPCGTSIAPPTTICASGQIKALFGDMPSADHDTLTPPTPTLAAQNTPLRGYFAAPEPWSIPAWLADAALLALDTETAVAAGTTYDPKLNRTALDPHQGRLRLLTLSDGQNTMVLDTWAHPEALPALRPIIEDPARVIVAHNATFDMKQMLHASFDICANWADTMLMAKVLDGGSYSHQPGAYKLGSLATRFLQRSMDKAEQTSDWSLPNLTEEQLAYAALDATILPDLYRTLLPLLEADGLLPTIQVEFAALPAVARMEYEGLGIDAERWASLAQAAEDRLAVLLPQLRQAIGPINFNSPVQVKRALAEIGIIVVSTDDEHMHDALQAALNEPDQTLLETMRRVQACRLFHEYKQAGKQATTYGREWLRKHVNPVTGRIHAHFNQIVDTGRFSCGDPNIQNLPRGAYRTAFVPAAGHALVKVDYTAIELRILAALSGDKVMLSAFNNSEDLHTRTAALLLNIPEAAVTKAHRQIAKSANFGLAYGAGAETLRAYAATTFGVSMSLEEAKAHRAAWFRAYPGVKYWHNSQTCYVQQDTGIGAEDIWLADNSPKDVRTMLGRLRRKVQSYTIKLNTPCQGTGADGLKMAMGALDADRQAHPAAKLVACVHDELVYECPLADAVAVGQWVQDHMVKAMTTVVQGKVLIEAETTVCQNWAGEPLDVAPQKVVP